MIPKNHYTGVMTNAGDSREYVFDVKVIALVRVRALDESSARRVITSVLGSPSADVIKLANAPLQTRPRSSTPQTAGHSRAT